MPSWSEIEREAPELAATVRTRFERDVVAIMATLRKDGAPRISGIETVFRAGELWLGMMPGSRKARDLQRDGRVALHCATVDKEVKAGDSKISGVAVPVESDAEWNAYAGDRKNLPAARSFPLFKVDVFEVSHLKPAGDHLEIEWWTEGGGLRRVDRF